MVSDLLLIMTHEWHKEDMSWWEPGAPLANLSAASPSHRCWVFDPSAFAWLLPDKQALSRLPRRCWWELEVVSWAPVV